MDSLNRLSRRLKSLEKFPVFIQGYLRNIALGKAIKFVGTSKIDFQTLKKTEVSAILKNRNIVQNHIGQVHAIASVLLAETVTGVLIGMSIPDNKIPLIKNINVKFVKRSIGDQKAIATLDEAVLKDLFNTEKGEILVPVKVVDATNEEVISTEMLWAWITKK